MRQPMTDFFDYRAFFFAFMVLWVASCASTQNSFSSPPFTTENPQEAIATNTAIVSQDPENATAHYRLAGAYFQQGNDLQAEESIKKALRLDPINGLYFELLGDIAFRTQRYGVATNAFKSALRLQSNLLSAYLKLALVYEKSHENERAIASLEEVINQEPQYVEALYHLARLNFKQKKYAAAQTALNAGLMLEPNNKALLLLQIQIHSAQGNYYHAKTLTERFLEQHPGSYEAQHEQLKILFAQKEWQKALRLLESLQQAENLRLQDQLIEAQIFIAQGRFEDAKALLELLLEKNPLRAEIMIELAALLLQQGDLEKALTWLNRSIEVDDQHAQAHFLQASIFFKQGDSLQGDLALNQALALSPLNRTYQLLELRRKLMQGNFPPVEQALKGLRQNAPLDPEVLRLQADLLSLKGQHEQAESLIRDIQLIEDNDLLRFSLGRVLYFKEQYRAALPITTELVEKYPNDWESAYLHARILYQLGKFEDALSLLSPFLKKGVGEGFIHLLVGNFYRYQGDEAKAEEIYLSGLEAFPENIYLSEALSASYVNQKKWNLARSTILSALEQDSPFKAILFDRMASIAAQTGDLKQATAYLKRYHQMTDPVLKASSVHLENRLLFPIASPVLGYSQWNLPANGEPVPTPQAQ